MNHSAHTHTPHSALPQFSSIQADAVESEIDQILQNNRAALEQLLTAHQNSYSWDNLIAPLDDQDDSLSKTWSPMSHMNSVVNSDALREAYNACLPKLSQYNTELGQNQRLQQAYQFIADSTDFDRLQPVQQKIIRDALRDFRLFGVDLPEADKSRYLEIAQALSGLASKFEENLLDATQDWHKPIASEAELSGLPETARALARQAAEAKQQNGWLLTLEFPCYRAVMTYADDRALRQEMYHAFATRASETGPSAGRFDNTEIMCEILQLRHEKALLLGFQNYAELSLTTKMAESTDEVMRFLQDLAARAKPVAEQDLSDLKAFAHEQCQIKTLEAWDISYVSEKLRQHQFDLSQETLRQYFPVPQVLSGLFAIVQRLYGIQVKTTPERVDTWHPDVQFFEIYDADNQLRGQFYLDLYARPKKRGGAWMDDYQSRRKTGSTIQTPIAYLTCNFTPPVSDHPALLTHDEVLTLFHEFGHGLHHMLTQVDYLSASGIHGVEWDAVELPSQFMENWCWDPEALALISGHYETGEPLPEPLFNKMLAAKHFQAGMLMVRQLEFSLFDFRIHLEYDPQQQPGQMEQIHAEVRKQVSVILPPDFNRFAHSFSHIFAGGYGAGYYSYKWAEVLSSDAFSLFEEKGIFDRASGQSFLSHILEQGSSQTAAELFRTFRGRDAKIDALLRHSGIIK